MDQESSSAFDLDAYLARIGLAGRPRFAQVHRAHATSIPFENLDPRRGVPVELATEQLERKLVAQRRGGYCFEQNLLLAAALQALGAEVDLMLARVRLGSEPGAVRPRSHLLLRVRCEGAEWHADVGFGPGTLLEPLPFGPGPVQDQSGWRFRVLEDGPELLLQMAEGEGWVDLYGFRPEPVPFVDLETSNWSTSTHPRSPFVTGLIVSMQGKDGTRVSLSDRNGLALTEQTPAARRVTPVAIEQVPQLLEERFSLAGFSLRAGGELLRLERRAG
jgi:N-hydroxyarylamine O-acetyltransferase